jgi:hypothetical protein
VSIHSRRHNEPAAAASLAGMPEGEFAYFHFTGGRFDGVGGMPLEALRDLALYRELVVEVALKPPRPPARPQALR